MNIRRDMTRHGFTWLRSRPSPQMYRDSERERQLSISPFWLIFIPFFVLLCSAGSTLSKFLFLFIVRVCQLCQIRMKLKRKYSLSQNVLENHTIHWCCCQGPRFKKEGPLKCSCYFPSLVIQKHIYRLPNLQAYLMIRLASYLSGYIVQKQVIGYLLLTTTLTTVTVLITMILLLLLKII